jgi:hypothetical protein
MNQSSLMHFWKTPQPTQPGVPLYVLYRVFEGFEGISLTEALCGSHHERALGEFADTVTHNPLTTLTVT